jgi:AcrR family transcriptional regulator
MAANAETSELRNGRPRRGAANPRVGNSQEARMIDVAARMFQERGYDATRLQDIADEVGLLKGSLYHYIDSKEDLLFRLLESVHVEVERILDEVAAVEGLSPLDPRAALRPTPGELQPRPP